MQQSMNRLHARMAGTGTPATSFMNQPEPRSIGTFARGRQFCAGNFMFAGYLVEAPATAIWDLPIPDAAFEADLHGFAWLDDLAAVGNHEARNRAQDWTYEWIRRFGKGKGNGWQADLTGRRLMRWINHAIFLLNGRDSDDSKAFFNVTSRQIRYLTRRWKAASPGLPRFEALTGLIYAGLSLDGVDDIIDPVIAALARECAEQIDDEGGLPTRNPEELLEVFTLLTWIVDTLAQLERKPEAHITAAIERIAPALRALRHADGGLARFHGGGRGLEGRLDQALAASRTKKLRHKGLAMGFARLSKGRTSVVMDASAPPRKSASANAHASSLAFELTSGRRPMIVNCGSGVTFGSSWRRAGRATPSHSTLGLEGMSSSRLGPQRRVNGRETEMLIDTPGSMRFESRDNEDTVEFVAAHNGYVKSHGLTHMRKLILGRDGRSLAGEDTLLTVETGHEKQFDKIMDETALAGVRFQIRFHLHPDVDAELDLGGTVVSLELKSGEVWILRQNGRAQLSLEPSVYLEKGRLSPRVTKQIVLSGIANAHATRIGWTIGKAQDTPTVVKDLVYEDALLDS